MSAVTLRACAGSSNRFGGILLSISCCGGRGHLPCSVCALLVYLWAAYTAHFRMAILWLDHGGVRQWCPRWRGDRPRGGVVRPLSETGGEPNAPRRRNPGRAYCSRRRSGLSASNEHPSVTNAFAVGHSFADATLLPGPLCRSGQVFHDNQWVG